MLSKQKWVQTILVKAVRRADQVNGCAMLTKQKWVQTILEEARKDPFREVEFNPRRFERTMAKPAPDNRYAIFFTPRSGSSRLTDLSRKTGGLGDPGECFNPAFVPKIAQAYSARNLQEYLDLVMRNRSPTGVFGCEATYIHLFQIFHSGRRFLDLVKPQTVIWLNREDIIAQAVSISRMMQTRVSHSVQAAKEDIAKADHIFTYNSKGICNILNRLRWMEIGTERLIERSGLTPLRLSYEQCVSLPEVELMSRIASHVGIPLDQLDLTGLESDHKKVSGEKSMDFVTRFRRENPGVIAQMDRERAPMLAAHAAGNAG